MKTTQYSKGIDGEDIAARWLENNGMPVVEKRYRGGDGEIDLIAKDHQIVVFVEVKYRPNLPKGCGLSSVTAGKQKRIGHAAVHFLVEREWTGCQIRFDIIEITKDGVLHIPNAFVPQNWPL